MNNLNIDIPGISIEVLDNGNLRLEDKSYSEFAIVDIHPIHLRLMAEKLGFVREVSASEADTLRTCAELRRRLLALKERVDHLGEYLALHSDHRHADLTYETTYATATVDICEAYCADFPERVGNAGGNAESVTKPGANPEETQRVIAPKQHELIV